MNYLTSLIYIELKRIFSEKYRGDLELLEDSKKEVLLLFKDSDVRDELIDHLDYLIEDAE